MFILLYTKIISNLLSYEICKFNLINNYNYILLSKKIFNI